MLAYIQFLYVSDNASTMLKVVDAQDARSSVHLC